MVEGWYDRVNGEGLHFVGDELVLLTSFLGMFLSRCVANAVLNLGRALPGDRWSCKDCTASSSRDSTSDPR